MTLGDETGPSLAESEANELKQARNESMQNEKSDLENVTCLIDQRPHQSTTPKKSPEEAEIKDMQEQDDMVVSPPMSPPPSYPPPPLPYTAPDDAEILGGKPKPRNRNASNHVAAPPLVPAISMDEDEDEDEEQKLARRRRRQQQMQQLSRRSLLEDDHGAGDKEEAEEARRQRNQMIACCSSSLSSRSCGVRFDGERDDDDDEENGGGRDSSGSPNQACDKRVRQLGGDAAGGEDMDNGVPLLVLTKTQTEGEGRTSRGQNQHHKRETAPTPALSPARGSRRVHGMGPTSPYPPRTPTSSSVASSPGQSDRELLLKERLKMSRYEVEEWKRRYAEMQEKAMVAMKKTSALQAQQSTTATSATSSVSRLLPPASPRRMLSLWRQSTPLNTPQQPETGEDDEAGDDDSQEAMDPNSSDPEVADQTPDRKKQTTSTSPALSSTNSSTSSRPRNLSRHERSRTMGDGVFTMEDMTSTVQTLRQQNANLSEQCVALQEERDKSQTALDAIRATNVKLNDQRAELELDYMNQLAQLAQRKRNVEEEMKAKLRGKISSIVFLRKHILSQDAKIATLEEQFIALNSRIRQVDEEKDNDDDDDDDEDEEEDKDADDNDGKAAEEPKQGVAPKSPIPSGRTLDHQRLQSPTPHQKDSDDSSVPEEQGEATTAPATPTLQTKRRLARERERTLVRVTVLEQDNERLREKITSLTTQNNDLREEVQTLRDRVVKLSNLEVDTVPELVSKLSTTQSALVDAQDMCKTLREERTLLEETLREDLSVVTSEKSRMEAEFLNQLMEIEKKHKTNLDAVKRQNVEKEERLVMLQRKVALLQEQVVRLEGMSELNDIECDDYDLSGMGGNLGCGGETFRSKRSGTPTFAAFYGEEEGAPSSSSDAVVQSLRAKLQEQEDANMSLLRQLNELQQKVNHNSDEMDLTASVSQSTGASDDGEQWC